jgi:hypothetical protein
LLSAYVNKIFHYQTHSASPSQVPNGSHWQMYQLHYTRGYQRRISFMPSMHQTMINDLCQYSFPQVGFDFDKFIFFICAFYLHATQSKASKYFFHSCYLNIFYDTSPSNYHITLVHQ